MTLHYEAPTASQALPLIISDLLEYGDEVGSRNGRVKEVLNPQIVITNPVKREILSLNRKANVFAQIAETMWVISGRNDIEWLSAYLPRAADYSDDGETWRGGYGPRIRGWSALQEKVEGGKRVFGVHHIDQLAHVVETLKADPLSRRAVIAIYDPARDTDPGKDIPCNDFLQFQNRGGRLYLSVTIRSNDVMWGWSGINAFEWSTLQEMVASLLGIQVGDLTFNIGNLHIYEQHWERARRIEYEQADYPSVRFDPYGHVKSIRDLNTLLERWFDWEEICRDGRATLDLLDEWVEPLTKSWAAAIAYFWQREDHWLEMLAGTALGVAVARTPASVLPQPRQTSRSAVVGAGTNPPSHERVMAFYGFVKDLHATKHASYGDSWKKRGEKMSILANIARKVDRLGVGDEFDSSADTVIDLLVYLIKYSYWIYDRDEGPDNVNLLLGYMLGETEENSPEHNWQTRIPEDFDAYADRVDELDVATKAEFLNDMIRRVAPIARDLWLAENHDGDDYRGADRD